MSLSDAQDACLRRHGNLTGLQKERDMLIEAQRLAEELASVYMKSGFM